MKINFFNANLAAAVRHAGVTANTANAQLPTVAFLRALIDDNTIS